MGEVNVHRNARLHCVDGLVAPDLLKAIAFTFLTLRTKEVARRSEGYDENEGEE